MLVLGVVGAQPLPVTPLQTSDPEQLAKDLREKKPIAPSDCQALELWECQPDVAWRVADISIRWSQLDDDPELEAIVVAEASAEIGFAAYVFDQRGTWNLVGSFFDRRARDGEGMVRVHKLTADSPPLVLITRDLGGSDSSIFTTEAFQLREGKLWPVVHITDREEVQIKGPWIRRQQVFASKNRLVIYSRREEPPGRVVEKKCEVRRWDVGAHTFVAVPSENAEYCEKGRPIRGKSFVSGGFPVYP